MSTCANGDTLAAALAGAGGCCCRGRVLAAAPWQTPYGEVSLPFELHKVPGAPVYYVIGLSGVPGCGKRGAYVQCGLCGHRWRRGGVRCPGDAGARLSTAAAHPRGDRPARQRIVISHYHADHIYGLQAFKDHAGDPPVWAQRADAWLCRRNRASQGEDAQRRLAQRREALFPWVDEDTYIVRRTTPLTIRRASRWVACTSN